MPSPPPLPLPAAPQALQTTALAPCQGSGLKSEITLILSLFGKIKCRLMQGGFTSFLSNSCARLLFKEQVQDFIYLLIDLFMILKNIYVSFQILQIYTTSVVWYDVGVQSPNGMAVGGATVFQTSYHTALPPCDMAVRVSSFGELYHMVVMV